MSDDRLTGPHQAASAWEGVMDSASFGGNGAEIPMTQLDNADPVLLDEAMLAVERVAFTAGFTLGVEVESFEREFASYCGTEHAVGVSSGTDALVLALRSVGVGPDDEVIVPANSFIATAEAVSLVGAEPKLVDVDPDTQLITAEILDSNIGSRTRCVIPVHLYGRTVDMEPLLEVARRENLTVIEDACQAHGAEYRGRRVGTLGDCGCFSFYPAKNLGAWGDGGAVVTADDRVAEELRLLRSHGEHSRYHHRITGTTARLHALQAAVLRVKLPHLESWNSARRWIAGALTQALADADLTLPAPVPSGHDHVFHQYVVKCPDRDGLQAHLARLGISSAIHYPVPIHLTPAYSHLGLGPGSLPVVEQLAAEICSLPMFPAMSESQISRVAEGVRLFSEAPDHATGRIAV